MLLKHYIQIIISPIILLSGCLHPLHGQIITTIAGTGVRGFSGDDGPATAAELDQPYSIAVDDSDCIYIIDVGKDNISKIFVNGVIRTIAGNRHYNHYDPDAPSGYNGDGIAATDAKLGKPHGIVTDHSGNVFFSEFHNNIIRKISANGIVTIIEGIAPDFGYKYMGDNKAATTNAITGPNDITIDSAGNLYSADEHSNTIRKISKNGGMNIIAGTGQKGYTGDEGMATNAHLNKPYSVAVDDSGNIFFSDTYNHVVRKIKPNGIITTYAGNGEAGYSGDGSSAILAKLTMPFGIATDKSGNLYIADKKNHVIRYVSPKGIINTLAGNGHKGYSGDNGMATNATLNEPSDVAIDNTGNLLIADNQNHVIRKVTFSPPPRKKTHLKDGFNLSVDSENEVLIVVVDSEAYSSFTITDIKDKVLIHQLIKGSETNIDISMLLPAHYYLNLRKGEKVKTKMFVKER